MSSYLGNIPSNNFVSLKRQVITGNGGSTYTLDHSVASVNDVAIFVNNVRQDPASYSISTTSLTLGGTISSSDSCYVLFLGQALQTVTPDTGTVTGDMLSKPFNYDSGTLYLDDTNNRVGILDTSPSYPLEVNGTIRSVGTNNLPALVVDGNSTDEGDIAVLDNQILTFGHHALDGNTGSFTERMRIDTSGNLLIGKTTLEYDSTAGNIIRNDGFISAIRSGGNVTDFNRLSSDGEIIRLSQDGTTVGSIGVISTDRFFIGSGSGLDGIGIDGHLFPTTNTGSLNDNNMDCGIASSRWDDIRATNGSIITSDQNEKQSIQSLTTAEMNVAKRLSSLIKTFKWNSAVEKKGDNARTHTGIIAQDVQQAFTDEGLDVGKYALFISDTWWEKEIFVEATEEQDAYTYIDVKEEATEGYTEKTRLGVRYTELFAFIQAYNDQRFAELETRIQTLENN